MRHTTPFNTRLSFRRLWSLGLGVIALLSLSSLAEGTVSKSFEQSYKEMQSKLQELKSKGQKVGDDTEKQMNDLLAQMNHEHTELKRKLEQKNGEISKRVEQTKEISQDWLSRTKRAFTEFGTGIAKAWDALHQPSEPQHPNKPNSSSHEDHL
jgi:hypothetical protein